MTYARGATLTGVGFQPSSAPPLGPGMDVHQWIVSEIGDIVGEPVTVVALKSPGSAAATSYFNAGPLVNNLLIRWGFKINGVTVDYAPRAIQMTGRWIDAYTFDVESYQYVPCNTPTTTPDGLGTGWTAGQIAAEFASQMGGRNIATTIWPTGQPVYWTECLEPGEAFVALGDEGQVLGEVGTWLGLLSINSGGQVTFNKASNNPLAGNAGMWVVREGADAILAYFGEPGNWCVNLSGSTSQAPWTTDPTHVVVDVTSFEALGFIETSTKRDDSRGLPACYVDADGLFFTRDGPDAEPVLTPSEPDPYQPPAPPPPPAVGEPDPIFLGPEPDPYSPNGEREINGDGARETGDDGRSLLDIILDRPGPGGNGDAAPPEPGAPPLMLPAGPTPAPSPGAPSAPSAPSATAPTAAGMPVAALVGGGLLLLLLVNREKK